MGQKTGLLQRRRIEAVEMKLLRPLAGYTLYDHKTNDYIRRELRITSILDNIDEYRCNWLSLAKNATKLNPFEIIPLQTTRKENNWKTEQALARAAVTLEVQSLMSMMMMVNSYLYFPSLLSDAGKMQFKECEHNSVKHL